MFRVHSHGFAVAFKNGYEFSVCFSGHIEKDRAGNTLAAWGQVIIFSPSGEEVFEGHTSPEQVGVLLAAASVSPFNLDTVQEVYDTLD